jgi:hypothetical protein
MKLAGFEDSAISHALSPIAAVFPACRSMIWAEIEEILSYLTIEEVTMGLGSASRSGYLLLGRERNSRIGERGRRSVRYCSRGDWSLAKLQRSEESKETLRIGSKSLRICDKILLASYPRSGNSFIRNVLEGASGIVTGSDSRPNRKLSSALLRYGFRGEGIVDASVWAVKTHFPERMGYRRFRAQRCVLLVRSPFDAVRSYFHMGFTNTHDCALKLFGLNSQWRRPVCGDASMTFGWN